MSPTHNAAQPRQEDVEANLLALFDVSVETRARLLPGCTGIAVSSSCVPVTFRMVWRKSALSKPV